MNPTDPDGTGPSESVPDAPKPWEAAPQPEEEENTGPPVADGGGSGDLLGGAADAGIGGLNAASGAAELAGGALEGAGGCLEGCAGCSAAILLLLFTAAGTAMAVFR